MGKKVLIWINALLCNVVSIKFSIFFSRFWNIHHYWFLFLLLDFQIVKQKPLPNSAASVSAAVRVCSCVFAGQRCPSSRCSPGSSTWSQEVSFIPGDVCPPTLYCNILQYISSPGQRWAGQVHRWSTSRSSPIFLAFFSFLYELNKI